MPEYIVFLRAVNVRPRWVKMDVLRRLLDERGFGPAQTHIQSGNVLVQSRRRSTAAVAGDLEPILAAAFGFAIPCIVRTPSELTDLARTIDSTPPSLSGEVQTYVALTTGGHGADHAAALESSATDGEAAKVVGADILLWLTKSANEAKLTNAKIERLLGKTVATSRNAAVIRAVAAKWGAPRSQPY